MFMPGTTVGGTVTCADSGPTESNGTVVVPNWARLPGSCRPLPVSVSWTGAERLKVSGGTSAITGRSKVTTPMLGGTGTGFAERTGALLSIMTTAPTS